MDSELKSNVIRSSEKVQYKASHEKVNKNEIIEIMPKLGNSVKFPVHFLVTLLRSEHHQERRQGWWQAQALLSHWGPHGPRLRWLRDRETGVAPFLPPSNSPLFKYVTRQVCNYSINYYNGGKYPLPQTLLVRYIYIIVCCKKPS